MNNFYTRKIQDLKVKLNFKTTMCSNNYYIRALLHLHTTGVQICITSCTSLDNLLLNVMIRGGKCRRKKCVTTPTSSQTITTSVIRH